MTLEVLSQRAPWYVAGPIIGALIVGLLWITNKPLGALGGYIEFEEWAVGKSTVAGWRVLFIAGVVVGGFVSALAGPGWNPSLSYGSFDLAFGSSFLLKTSVLFGAGVLIGIGGRMAGGCTSGHGLCGTSFGSPASLVCMATFMATAITFMFGILPLLGG